jgi:hypothetical protein
MNPVSHRVPLVVLTLTAALLSVQLWLEFRPRQRGRREHRAASAERPNPRRLWRAQLWLGGLLLSLHEMGFWVAVPAFVALYLRVEAGRRWRLALALAGLLTGSLYALSLALGVHMPAGVWAGPPWR